MTAISSVRYPITKPEDRCPYPVGTKVVYWNWTGAKAEPIEYYAGLVEVITPESSHVAQHQSLVAAEGELVIRFLDTQGKPAGSYDRVLSYPVRPGEPQRWFAVGVDPNA